MSLEDQENELASTWDRFEEHPENIWGNQLVNTVEKVKAWCATRSEDIDNDKQLSNYCEAIPGYEYIHIYTATGNRDKRSLASPSTTDWNSQELDHRTLQPAGAIFALPSLTTSTFPRFLVQSLTAAPDRSKTTTSAETTTPLSVLRFQLSSHNVAIKQSPTGPASKSIYSECDGLASKLGSLAIWCNSHSTEISSDATVSEICFDTWTPTTIKPSSTPSFARGPAAKITEEKTLTGSSSYPRGLPASTTHQQVRAEKEQPYQSSIQSDTNNVMSDRYSVELADQRTGESNSIASSPKTYPVVYPVTESGHNYAYVTSMYSKALAYMTSHSPDEQLWKSADADMISYSYQLADIRHWCHTALTWNADPGVTTYCEGMPESELWQRRMVTTSASYMLLQAYLETSSQTTSSRARATSTTALAAATLDAHGPVVVGVTYPTSSTTPTLGAPISLLFSAITSAANSVLKNKASSSPTKGSPSLQEQGNRHPTPQPQGNHHTKRRDVTDPASSGSQLSSTMAGITASDGTTLITKTISITNIFEVTSTTTLDTSDTIASEQATESSQSSTLQSTTTKPLNRRKDILAGWGVTNHHHSAEVGTNLLRLPPHRWDCVRRPHSCVTILALVGVLCGIPFGMVLLVLFGACVRCCMKRRAAKKSEEEKKKSAEEERKRKPRLDAAMVRQQFAKMGARLGGEWGWAGSSEKTKKGRRSSGETIEMAEDKTY